MEGVLEQAGKSMFKRVEEEVHSKEICFPFKMIWCVRLRAACAFLGKQVHADATTPPPQLDIHP